MCNRYALSKRQEELILQDYETLDLYFMERFNIAPTQAAPVVLIENGKLTCREMKWGFIPKWSKAPVTNAQFETLADKPTFKEAFETRRCLIPASGFYEWQDFERRKQPILFLLNGERTFYFAGLYSAKFDDECFVIVTTAANRFVSPIHNRMPLILSADDHGKWIDPKSQVYKTVTPTAEEMKTYWVSDRMNSSRNADPEAAQPLTATVRSIFGGYPLPDGLPEKATVKIRSFDPGYYQVEYNGNVFQVFMGGVSFKGETGNLL
ncbi:MAG TPA: SOS response-associated peptidase [Verrucomicrobiae bacterium]|jgi:putative SOS response-associated peptidase YedK|nr:SOS response-associated peptidase [Verrucomicrobiae bacterium]